MLAPDCLQVNRDEVFNKDGCQHWFKLTLNNLGKNHSEAVVLPYRTWPEQNCDHLCRLNSDQIIDCVAYYAPVDKSTRL